MKIHQIHIVTTFFWLNSTFLFILLPLVVHFYIGDYLLLKCMSQRVTNSLAIKLTHANA